MGIAGMFAACDVGRDDRPQRPARGAAPPEGQLLVQVDDRGIVVPSAGDRRVVVRGAQTFDLTESGTHVTAVTEEIDPQSGHLLKRSSLLLVDETGEREVVARAGPDAAIGKALASTDGTRIAYRLTVWDRGAPTTSEPASELLCVVEVASERSKCFMELPEVFDFEWSPDGRQLVASGPGTAPVYVVDALADSARVLLPPGGTPSVRAALRDAGYGEALQFVLPAWSASGEYVAVTAMIERGGSAPIVVDADGAVVALGHANSDFQMVEWSPTEDTLAYTRGYSGLGPDDYPFGVRLLDVATGEDAILVSTAQRPQPFVFDLKWSPTGSWLALDHASSLQIVDAGDGSSFDLDLGIEPRDDGVELLRDWGP